MISVNARRLFLCAQPVDMRKGMDGLASVVLSQLQLNPNGGDIFIFLGRRGTSLKALCWDTDGYWLCTKRLAEGRFLIPLVERSDGRPAALELSEAEWHLLLDGIVVRERVLLKRHHRTLPEVPVGDVALAS
jgi:transposase